MVSYKPIQIKLCISKRDRKQNWEEKHINSSTHNGFYLFIIVRNVLTDAHTYGHYNNIKSCVSVSLADCQKIGQIHYVVQWRRYRIRGRAFRNHFHLFVSYCKCSGSRVFNLDFRKLIIYFKHLNIVMACIQMTGIVYTVRNVCQKKRKLYFKLRMWELESQYQFDVVPSRDSNSTDTLNFWDQSRPVSRILRASNGFHTNIASVHSGAILQPFLRIV